MSVLSTRELTDLAAEWLAQRYADALIVREMSIGNWGSARLDVAAISAEQIIGVEVKGPTDRPDRLGLQGERYGRVASEMWLLPSPDVAKRCESKIPIGWGRLRLDGDGIDAQHQLRVDAVAEPLANCALSLVECLWRDELLELARRRQIILPGGQRAYRHNLQREIAGALPLRELRRDIIDALRRRNWRSATRRTSWAHEAAHG